MSSAQEVFDFGADDFQNEHSKCVDGPFSVTQLKRLAVKEPIDSHGLISDGRQRRLKVGDVALQQIGDILELRSENGSFSVFVFIGPATA